MALTAEVTAMEMMDLNEGFAEITITYKIDGTSFAVRQFRLDVNKTWNPETRHAMLDRIKGVGQELFRSQTRFQTIQANLVGQSIPIS